MGKMERSLSRKSGLVKEISHGKRVTAVCLTNVLRAISSLFLSYWFFLNFNDAPPPPAQILLSSDSLNAS